MGALLEGSRGVWRTYVMGSLGKSPGMNGIPVILGSDFIVPTSPSMYSSVPFFAFAPYIFIFLQSDDPPNDQQPWLNALYM